MTMEKKVEAMDLSDFFNKLFAAQTEAEVSDLLDKTPEFFQEKMWLYLDDVPPLNKVQDLRMQMKEWSKKIILNQALKSIKESISFYDWLSGIPLLPIYITKPLRDNYHCCGMVYDNFSDCYSEFDEKSFYDDALKKIERWVNLLGLKRFQECQQF